MKPYEGKCNKKGLKSFAPEYAIMVYWPHPLYPVNFLIQ